jgi:hypothetical protein
MPYPQMRVGFNLARLRSERPQSHPCNSYARAFSAEGASLIAERQLWNFHRLLRLDARELHNLGPLLGFVGDEFAEGGCLSRLAPYLTSLDERAKGLLLGVVPYVHTDYSTDHMVEELARLVDTSPAATVELLERMLDANTPNYDMDDKLKRLLQKLYGIGYRAEALRCIEKLRKTLPGMIELYKHLVAESPAS